MSAGQYQAIRWIEAKNIGSTEIPPFGVVEVYSAALENPGRIMIEVRRPTVDSKTPVAINSFKPIPANDYGVVTFDAPVVALYTGTAPTSGEEWGATDDQYYLTKGHTGFISLGDIDSDRDIGLFVTVSGGSELIGGCLAENHTGRGEEFDIHLGTWNAGSQKWIYDTENTVVAIDWRYGVPYPEAGATGLFMARASTSNGIIYEAVALDCEATPEGCDGEE